MGEKLETVKDKLVENLETNYPARKNQSLHQFGAKLEPTLAKRMMSQPLKRLQSEEPNNLLSMDPQALLLSDPQALPSEEPNNLLSTDLQALLLSDPQADPQALNLLSEPNKTAMMRITI